MKKLMSVVICRLGWPDDLSGVATAATEGMKQKSFPRQRG